MTDPLQAVSALWDRVLKGPGVETMRQKGLAREDVGYFTSPDQPDDQPTYDPGMKAMCPVCATGLTGNNVTTVSLMAMEGDAVGVSLFYRMHRTCAEKLTPEQAGQIDEQALKIGGEIARAVGVAGARKRDFAIVTKSAGPGGVRNLAYLNARLAKVRKKKANFQGIPVVIDRPKGHVQEGKGPDGKPWRRVYLYDYGYIPKTEGGDDEELDVFLGTAETSKAWWAVQVKDDGSFDEYKLFLGFPSEEHARLAYQMHIPTKFLQGFFEGSVGQVKALLGLSPTEVRKRLNLDALRSVVQRLSK